MHRLLCTDDARVRPWYRQAISYFDADGSTTSWSSPYPFTTTGELGLSAMTVVTSPSGVVEGVFAADYELWMISSLLNSSLAGSAKGKGRSFAYIVEAASGKLIGSSAGERLYNAPERVSASASIHPSIAASAAVLEAPPYEWSNRAAWADGMTVKHGSAFDGWQVHSREYTSGENGLRWVVVGGQEMRCDAATEIWNEADGRCEVCAAGTEPGPTGWVCEDCPPNSAGNAGSCHPCAAGTRPLDDASSCVPCPPNEVPTDDGLSCRPCEFGQQPNAAGTACECDPGRYDRSFGLIFCFERDWPGYPRPVDPVRSDTKSGGVAIFEQKQELALGYQCLPCPDCVRCNSTGPPVPQKGYIMSPTSRALFSSSDGLNTNTTEYVMNMTRLVGLLGHDVVVREFLQDHDSRTEWSRGARASIDTLPNFTAYVEACRNLPELWEQPASSGTCGRGHNSEMALESYCEYDASQGICVPAKHRFSLNRSLFKCPSYNETHTACDAATEERFNASDLNITNTTNSSSSFQLSYMSDVGGSCRAHHDGTLCGACDIPSDKAGAFFAPEFSGGMKNVCTKCDRPIKKFAATLVVIAILFALALWMYRYLEKKSASLDELRIHYTLLQKAMQAANTLRSGQSDEDSDKVSLIQTLRVIVGNLQIIVTLPVTLKCESLSSNRHRCMYLTARANSPLQGDHAVLQLHL